MSSSSQTTGAASRNSPYIRPTSRSAADGADSWKHDRYEPDSRPRRGGGNARGPPRGDDSRAPMFFPRDKSNDNDVKPTGKLTIENLHYDVSDAELKELFQQIGPVVKAYIKYDRSGRSTGTAIVIYENPNHALEAKNEYDGAKAKGQVISITQEMRADRIQKEASQRSLLSRFDLSSRLKGGDSESRLVPSSELADRLGSAFRAGREGTTRGVPKQATRRGPQRGPSQPQRKEKRKPVTAADLDAELEAFMKAPSTSSSSINKPTTTPSEAAPSAVQDVEMA